MTVRLGEASRWQVGELWDRFYGELDTEQIWKRKFLDRLVHEGVVEDEDGRIDGASYRTSTAALQGLFLYNKGNMEGAIAMAEGLRGHGQARGGLETRTGPAV